jgi:exosome complex exonuclease DIS3/RRP44
MATILQSFLRCGRNGKITKVVREHYLRDDIFCGLDGCTLCSGKQRFQPAPPWRVLIPCNR